MHFTFYLDSYKKIALHCLTEVKAGWPGNGS